MANVTRRNFLQAAAVAGGMVGLAGCNAGTGTTGSAADPLAAPAADKYPIDPDGEKVEAKWSSETSRKDKWTRVTNPDGGAELGVMDTAKIIQVDGYAFKDMNGNGKLDLYEDWRQSPEDRAKALAESMSAEEILPLMWHNGCNSTTAPLADDDAASLQAGMRAGVSRAQAAPDNYVEAINWINAVQEECEKSAYGIPYLNSTDQYQNFEIPDNDGLVASMDMDIIRRAAKVQAKVWRATGVRCLLGPQIDISTNPTYCRYSGSASEDPALNRDFARAFITGLQSTFGDDACTDDQGWGKDSILGMAKHYCGAGAVEGGRNDHSDGGKYDVFPGDNFKAHLIPFLDGALNLGSKTGACASIMPNYGIAYDENLKYGDNVGGGFSEMRTSYLRNAGWDGMVTTDWQITGDSEPGAMMKNRVWGVEDLTPDERQLKGLKAGDDQFGGEFDVENLTKAYESLEAEVGADEALARVRDSACRIFTVMNYVDLFDQPYSDREEAQALFEDEANTALGVEAAEKSIVMVKNKGNVISKAGLGDKPRCYIPQALVGGGMFSTTPAKFQLAIDEDVAGKYFDVLTDTVGEPTGKAAGGFPGMPVDENASSDPVYQASDAKMPSDEELAQCKYAILVVDCPTGESSLTTNEDGTVTCTPASLQYRPYTADGDNVRRESIAGNVMGSANGTVWDSQSGGVKENRSHYGQTTVCGNESDLDRVIEVRSKLPEDAKLILVVEATHPMCFHEIEPYADVILVHFMMSQGVNGVALANIVTGQTEPSALLPCQMPKDMSEVEGQDEDVPRDMVPYTDSEGNAYDFAFGLNWSGKISDERTKTYGATPLTEPETKVVAS